MIQQIIDKLFCKHKWKTHNKVKYNWVEKVPLRGTEYYYLPQYQEQKFSEITEILICDNCGKVKKIDY